MKKLLITGANGSLGTVCRERLCHLAESIRLGVLEELNDTLQNEEVFVCDLADKSAVEKMVDGCDGIIHMGGQATEATWERLRAANVDGVLNLYEAARKSSVKPRILFASSNHTIGFHEKSTQLDATSLTRPDSLYGVTKVFGEALARMYFDKFGIETALVRIGSSFPEPLNHRMLATWLSHDDFVSLVECIYRTPRLGCPIIYGVSNNDENSWDNTLVNFLGWRPKDNAEDFRAKVEQMCERPRLNSPDAMFHGGLFCADGIHED